MIRKYVVIEMECNICNKFDREDYIDTASKLDYANEMRKQGWKISRNFKETICPECRKRVLHE